MKRAIAAVVCLLAPAAWGQLNLDYHFTYDGTYTPAGLTTPVSVYTLTESTTGDHVLGAIVLDIGADYLGYGGNPFQVGVQSRVYHPTPTAYDANAWLATETFANQSDSHFQFPPDWVPAIVLPTEKNDGSLGTYIDPYGQTEVRGLGGLTVAVAVPVAERAPVIDVVRVGIPGSSAVYLWGQICDELGRVRDLDGVQFPMPYQNTWQGSGTGGRTATDPNDPTVQWTQSANWSRGVLPDLSDGVRVEMTNPGLLLAASGSVGSLYVDSSSPGTSFHIPASANVSVTGSLIVGEHSTAMASQSGTAHSLFFSLGENPGAAGTYELTDGRLTVERTAYVGKDAKGMFTQTGGTVQVGSRINLGHFDAAEGTYRLLGGYVTAATVDVGYGRSLFHQTGGSLNADKVYVWRTSRYRLDEGEVRARLETVRGTFTQSGGENLVSERLTVGEYSDPGLYELRGGVLNATAITGKVTMFGGGFSVQSMDGVLVNDGGVISPGQSIGTMSLWGLVQKSGTLEIELGALADFDKVLIAWDSPELGGILDLRSLSGYRPREGESFPVVTITSSDPNKQHYTGDFQAIISDITTGLPGGQAFSGAPTGPDYRVTFLGFTHGDANWDHKVDEGDLALMGGSWRKGGTRPFAGDTNLDEVVNASDLSLMGGNWRQGGKGWGDGDFDGNGRVDGGDLALIGGNWMQRLMAWPDADFTGNGKVDGGDIALLAGDWMWRLPAAAPPGVALPEPACAGLLLGAGLGLMGRQRRR